MKKFVVLMLVLAMVAAFAACAETSNTSSEATKDEANTSSVAESSVEEQSNTDDIKVMTYAEYLAAEIDSEVVVETYVQANQSWWDNKITLYCQSAEGAVFVYELACTEEDSAKLVPGTKIRVTGTKGEWGGEVEIMSGTFEFVEGGDTYVAEAVDVTDKLGTDELINDMNKLVAFKGLTFKSLEYKNGEAGPGNDIYVTFTKNDAEYAFCVEAYLTDNNSDVYKAVGELKEGDVVDVEGFLYWYNGANPHITAITVAE